MKKNPNVFENQILLWPNTDKEKTLAGKVALQREVFSEALDMLGNIGKWTVQLDEGLYLTDPKQLNLSSPIATLHQMGRSSKLTLITLAQRPAHLPLIIYSSATHAFAGQARERVDSERMANLGGKTSSKELMSTLSNLERQEFLWVPTASKRSPEILNLAL